MRRKAAATEPESGTSGWRWWNVRAWPLTRQFLLALLVLYFGKEALVTIVSPPFSGHDEVAHYSYVRVVAKDHRLPKIPDLADWRVEFNKRSTTPGDFVPPELYKYCRYFTQDWFCDPDNPVWAKSPPYAITYSGQYYPSGWIYTANHPPLYYLLMTPIYWATEGASPAAQQFAMRAAAIPLGMITVILAYLLVGVLFPGEAFLAITVPAFVAFQPQVSYEAAMVNNDILCIALVSLVLYLLARGIRDRFPWRISVFTGVAFGFALLAKGTAIIAAPLIALAVIMAIGLRHVPQWVLRGGLMAVLAGLISSPWYIFLYRTYGNLSAFDQIEKLQYWNYAFQSKPTILDQLFNKDFAVMRWRETWGEFGWRLIHLSNATLWAIGIPCLIALGGLIWYVVKIVRRRDEPVDDPVLHPRRWQVEVLVLLFATAVVAYYAILQFGTSFALTQARYYFPAINAVAILLMLGLRTLFPRPWRPYAQTGILVALLLMNIFIYTQNVIPYWHYIVPPSPVWRLLPA
jgi:4-amino-4-deoxy-L-arabinose transferase-like glycosyltransferase